MVKFLSCFNRRRRPNILKSLWSFMEWLIFSPYILTRTSSELPLGIVITKTAPLSSLAHDQTCRDCVKACGRDSGESRYFCVYALCYRLSAMLSAESGGLCLGTATRSGVMPILLRSPLHYIVWHNRNEVYVKKLYIVAMVVLNLDIQM